MYKEDRERLTKRLEEAKEEAKRKQENVRDLQAKLETLDQLEMTKIMKKNNISPLELSEMLEKQKKKNDELLKGGDGND